LAVPGLAGFLFVFDRRIFDMTESDEILSDGLDVLLEASGRQFRYGADTNDAATAYSGVISMLQYDRTDDMPGGGRATVKGSILAGMAQFGSVVPRYRAPIFVDGRKYKVVRYSDDGTAYAIDIGEIN
jgi:hypothetical protein